MKRYNVDVNLAWSYDHHPSREALDEVPSSEGKWVLATDALPIEAERDQLREKVETLENRLRMSDKREMRHSETFQSNLRLGVRVSELEAELNQARANCSDCMPIEAERDQPAEVEDD